MPDLRDHLSHLVDHLESVFDRGGPLVTPTSTGLPGLDRLCGGGVGRGGWLVRSPPGLGATALLVTFVTGLAVRPRRTVVQLVTADLSAHELTVRLVAATAGVSVDRLTEGSVDADDWSRISAAVKALIDAGIWIVDAHRWSHAELEMWCREERPAPQAGATSWLVVDGLDRLRGSGVTSLRRLERLSGRSVVAATNAEGDDETAAGVVTSLQMAETGHTTVHVDRSPVPEHKGHRVRLGIDPSTLRVREVPGPHPGPGQLAFEGLARGGSSS